jgi:integrase
MHSDDDPSEDALPAGEAGEPLSAGTTPGNPPLLLEPPIGRADDRPPDLPAGPTWRQELPRWLASLNPGRTQVEYEKAVCYFFETPSVPLALHDLSFDLLLAYRGALALRAAAPERGVARPRRAMAATRRALPHADLAQLTGPAETGGDASGTSEQRPATSPLAPATVNLRLTALRQFLVHCALVGSLPQLSPEQIRSALRRLTIERRRPYQVLAEEEWTQFLDAARLPSALAEESGVLRAEAAHSERPRGPWGLPRAVRLARAATKPHNEKPDPDASNATARALPRSRAGLTGVRTAARDHALISLALATGLRAVELSQLDVGDLTREWNGGVEEWWLVLPDVKTKGQHGGRTLPLAPSLVEILLAYIRSTGRRWERDLDRATPLFLSRAGRRGARDADVASLPARHYAMRRLSPQHIRAIVDRVETQWLALRGGDERSAGETRKISPHALRHSTAIALLQGNDTSGRPPASVEHVRGWLGHFDIRTTQRYLAHLESRRHRRPFALALEQHPIPATDQADGGDAPPTNTDTPGTTLDGE